MLRDNMLAEMQEVNGEIAEREELIQTIALALLSGRNLFILGAPGQAKSFAVNEFRGQWRSVNWVCRSRIKIYLKIFPDWQQSEETLEYV